MSTDAEENKEVKHNLYFVKFEHIVRVDREGVVSIPEGVDPEEVAETVLVVHGFQSPRVFNIKPCSQEEYDAYVEAQGVVKQ